MDLILILSGISILAFGVIAWVEFCEPFDKRATKPLLLSLAAFLISGALVYTSYFYWGSETVKEYQSTVLGNINFSAPVTVREITTRYWGLLQRDERIEIMCN